MKTLFLTTVVALSLSAGGAFAQPSQAQGGGQTSPTGNTPNSSKMGAGMNNTDATKGNTGTTTTTGSSGTGMTGGMADPAKPTAANPSSQGNAGPGTVPGK